MDLSKGPSNLERYMRAYRIDLEGVYSMVPVMFAILGESTPKQIAEIDRAVEELTIANARMVCLVTDPNLTYCNKYTSAPVKTHWEPGERHCPECERVAHPSQRKTTQC